MRIVFELVVESKNLASEIEKQKRRVEELTKAFKQTKEGTSEYKLLAAQLGEARISLIDLRRQQIDLNREFKSLAVPRDSLQGLRQEYALLTAQINLLTEAERKNANGQLLIKQAASIKKEINGIEESLGRFTGSVGNYQKGIISIFDLVSAGLITGGIERAIELIADGIAKGVKEFAAYEKALDRLSAITGVTGAQLDEFKEKIEGLTTIKIGDAEIVNSAKEIADAFTLVGSAQPELLKSADALALVTEKALILSQASGDTLDASVKALTTTLGQFQLPASEAERVMNELAAGAKAGASEIPDTTDALQKFGTTAANVNVTTTESIALVQTLAEQQLKGADAGTALRNVLAKIASADVLPRSAQEEFKRFGVSVDVLKDKSLPLEARLAELGKLSGDTSALVKVFGLENLNAATILTNSIGRYKEFVQQIGGTNEAYKQAEINSKNLSTAYENLKTKGLNVVVQGFEELSPVLAGILNLFAQGLGIVTGFFSFLAETPKFVKENKVELIGLATGLALLNGNLILASANSLRLAAAERIRNLVTIATTGAQAALNAVMAANPIGLILTAVSLLAIGFKKLYDSSETVRASIAGLGNVATEIFTIVKEAVTAFTRGFSQLFEGNFSGALDSFGEAIVKSNPVAVAFTQGKRLKDAFNKGFNEKLASEKSEKEQEERNKREVKATEVKVKAVTDLETAGADRVTKAEKAAAEKRIREIDAQIKRINELRKTVRDLDAQTITNKFDKQEIELQNERLTALEAVEEKRVEIEKRISEAGGKASERDREELALVSEQTASLKALYEKRFEELKEQRERTTNDRLTELRTIALETQKITEENALKAIEAEQRVSLETLKTERATLEKTRNERLQVIDEQFAKGELSERAYRSLTLKINEEYASNVLKLEQANKDKRVEAVRELTDAKVQGARVQLQAELFAIESALRADLEANRERAKLEGFDPTDSSIQLVEQAAAKRKKAELDFAKVEAEAIKANKDARIDAEKEVDEAKKESHEATLARIEEEKEKRRELKDAALEVLNEIASAAFDIERNRVDREQESKVKALDKEFDERRKKAKGNTKQLEKIDAEYEKRKAEIEKETARKKKDIAIKEAIIQGAIAFVKALPNYVLAAVVAIATAAQVAVISSQQFARGGALMFSGRNGAAQPYSYAQGGAHRPRSGVFGGRPHSAGGTKGTFDDGTQIEVEQDEVFVILNKRASKVLRALSEINYQFGGVSFAGMPGASSFGAGGAIDFTPQIALPGAGQSNNTTIVVQAEAGFSDEQIDRLASQIAGRTSEATKFAIGEGLDDRDRRLERNSSLATNREG